MSVNVKASLDKFEGQPEIRRFSVEGDASSKYSSFVERLRQVFPSLADQTRFSVYWKDRDEDFISFSSDAELTDGITNKQGDTFNVQIEGTQGSSGHEGRQHPCMDDPRTDVHHPSMDVHDWSDFAGDFPPMDFSGHDFHGMGHHGMGHRGMGHHGMGCGMGRGMGHRGMGHHGRGAHGMCSRGMGERGMGHRGMGHRGMGHHGMDHPGMGHYGMDHPGMGYHGMGHHGMWHPGMEHPGMGHHGSMGCHAFGAWGNRDWSAFCPGNKTGSCQKKGEGKDAKVEDHVTTQEGTEMKDPAPAVPRES